MKVDQLYILSVDNVDSRYDRNLYQELARGTDSLIGKYQPRLGDKLKEIWIDNLDGSARDPEKLHEQFKSMKFSKKIRMPSSDNAGMYVIAHSKGGAGTNIGGLDVKEFAYIFKYLGINIRKLCILTCCVARQRDENKKLSDRNPSFLMDLCRELKEPGMMVAGWKYFISISQPETTYVKDASGNPEAIQVGAIGKKLFALPPKQPTEISEKDLKLITQDLRAKYKFVYTWNGSEVVDARAQWSDRMLVHVNP